MSGARLLLLTGVSNRKTTHGIAADALAKVSRRGKEAQLLVVKDLHFSESNSIPPAVEALSPGGGR